MDIAIIAIFIIFVIVSIGISTTSGANPLKAWRYCLIKLTHRYRVDIRATLANEGGFYQDITDILPPYFLIRQVVFLKNIPGIKNLYIMPNRLSNLDQTITESLIFFYSEKTRQEFLNLLDITTKVFFYTASSFVELSEIVDYLANNVNCEISVHNKILKKLTDGKHHRYVIDHELSDNYNNFIPSSLKKSNRIDLESLTIGVRFYDKSSASQFKLSHNIKTIDLEQEVFNGKNNREYIIGQDKK